MLYKQMKEGLRKSFLRMTAMALGFALMVPVILPVAARKSQAAVPKESPIEAIHYQWTTNDYKGQMYIEFYVDRDIYYHIADLDRELAYSDYYKYIEDPHNQELIERVVDSFKSAGESAGYDDPTIAIEMVNFVQSKIKTVNDMKTKDQRDYPRYPMETLYEGQGDNQDRSILLAALLDGMGYASAIIEVDGHFAAAIRTIENYADGPYYQFDDGRWLFIETSDKSYDIGDIPQKYRTRPANFYFIN